MPKVVFTDFSGGWAPNRAPSALAPNELRDLCNYVVGPRGELMTRPPLLRSVSDLRIAEAWHINIVRGDITTDDWGLLIGNDGGGNSYFRFDETGTPTALTDVDGSATLDPSANSNSLRYKDIFYAFSDGISGSAGPTDVPVRCDVFDEQDYQKTGIDAPGAPSVAASAGGSLPDAVYQCLVTYYNHRTGAESIGGTPASVTTASPNSQIAWSSIPTASGAGTGAAQVTYRRLWRTLPNQVNEYYLVGTLTDNTTTVFTDNVAVEDMGSRLVDDTFSGSSITWSGGAAIWRERLWSCVTFTSTMGTAQEAIIYSRIGLPEQYAGDASLPIGTNESSPLRGIYAADDYLLALKAMSVWRVSGTGPSNFRVDRLRSPTGLADTYAIAGGPPGIFFLGSDGYFYFTDGSSVRSISEGLGKLDIHTGNGDNNGLVGTQIQSTLWPARNLFITTVYAPASNGGTETSTCLLYVYDYSKGSWSYWNFPGTPTKPRPRWLNLGYSELDRAPKMYVAGQTDTHAFINYFDDDLFNSTSNDTDIASEVGDGITDTSVSPNRSVRTKDFDAKDFGLEPGSAFIVRQVWVRVAWPVSMTSGTVPDSNWPLEFVFKLHGDTNLNQITGSVLATTGTISWSAEDRANDQWHAIGLSSQEHATTSIGLEIISAEGDAPRRHSITGIAFDVEGIKRNFIQPGQMLKNNITASVSGVVTGGADGMAYLCPDDPTMDDQSMVMDGSGNYAFTGLLPGSYTVIVTDVGNSQFKAEPVTLDYGDQTILNIPALAVGSTSGCP